MSLNIYKIGTISNTKIIAYLLYLMPLSILTGPFLPDLSVVIICIVFLIEAYKNNLIKYFKNNFFYIFTIFCLYLIFNSIISEYPLFSLKSSAVYFRFGVFSLAIWFILEREKDSKKYFLYGFIVALLIALIDGYTQYIFGKNIFGYEAAENNRLNLLASKGWLLGSYLVRLFPLFLALALTGYKHTKLSISIVFILWIATDVLIYLSGERTAIALMLLSNIFIIVLLKQFRLIRILSFSISILIIIILSLVNSDLRERNIDLTMSQFGIGGKNIIFFSRLHETYFHTSLEIFKDRPILGTGPNTYRIFCADQRYEYISPYSSENYNYSSCSTHPHNSFLQLLSETGIIGILFPIIIIFYFSKIVLNHIYYKIMSNKYKLDDYKICIIACLLCSLVPFIPSLNVFNNWINIIYYLPVGFYLHSVSKSD